MSSIFNPEFLQVSSGEVIDAIKRDGCFYFENAIQKNICNLIINDLSSNKININENDVHGVFYNDQYFHTHIMASSKSGFDLLTSNTLLDICDDYLASQYRLRSQRYYETYDSHKMQWHTDNKTPGKIDKIFDHPGLIFIFYMVDVNDGEFEYIKGSHEWSYKTGKNNFTDKEITDEYSNKIIQFKMPKGSVAICDARGIHRAHPIRKKGFIRKSIYFQVDARVDNAEKILLNSEFLDSIDSRKASYLGLGVNANYPHYPPSNESTLSMNDSIRFVGKTFRGAIFNRFKRAFDLLPQKLSWKIKLQIKKIFFNKIKK